MSARVITPDVAEYISGLNLNNVEEFVNSLAKEEAQHLLDSWSLWQLPYQRLPPGYWRRWLIRAGRGSGKTHGAARNINDIARDRTKIRTGEIAIIGRTHRDALRVCVEGPSGILATAPHDFRPRWWSGKGLLQWPNGVKGWVFSGDASETILGINASVVWADEVCQWPDPELAWWEHIEPALRIGWARAIITTTPKPTQFLRKLEAEPDTVVTLGTTYNNPWLDGGAKKALLRVYEDTRRGREQLLGQILEDLAGALWMQRTIDDYRAPRPENLARIIVSIDPAVSANEESAETGIIVHGVDYNGHGYVLEDDSGRYEATEWPNRAVALYHRHRADKIIAEKNNGGDLVELAIRAVDASIPYESVVATRGKVLRAEPVAALYERGMIHHCDRFVKLERQLTEWIPGPKAKSPDRLDALVHAVTFAQLKNEQPGDLDAYL